MKATRAPGELHMLTGPIAIGPGWLLPASITFSFVALIYLPAHGTVPDMRGLIASASALYVVGIAVVVPRLIRGIMPRKAGSSDPIVILGRGAGVIDRRDLAPRWRLAALAAGLFASAAMMVIAMRLVTEAATGSYPHAISNLVLATSATLVLGAIAPLPGLGGWTALLAIADLRGASAARRVAFAARGARLAAVLLAFVVTVVGISIGDPVSIPMGVALGVIVWASAGAAAGRDVAEQFFARHTAHELAKPLTTVHLADERLAALDSQGDTQAALVVDLDGAIQGAIGPRQIRSALRSGPTHRCVDAMIPLHRLTIHRGSAAATVLIVDLAGQGFAVVRDDAGIVVADAADVGRQVRVWSLLGEWGRRSHADTASQDRPAGRADDWPD